MASEYGWSDEIIWNLPLGRFRQITASIQQRRFIQVRQENSRFSWLARILAPFIAAGYMLGKDNPALDAAKEIAFDDIEAALYGATQFESRVDVPTEQEMSTEQAVARAAEKNSTGSFERFMIMTHQMDQRGKMI